ncbi:unnamed protein product [Cunninghamella blakesleeana]
MMVGVNNHRLGLIETLINYVDDTLKNINETRNKDDLPPIITSVGLIGFCDEYVYDHYSNTKMKHDHTIDSDLILYLHPLKNIINSLNLIKSISEKTPIILIIDITDGNDLQSRLAWVDLPAPLSEFSTYKKTILNLIKIVKAWSDSHFDGIIGDKNISMTNALLKFFDGSYRTMVFNHFNEYLPKYDSNNFIDMLQFTSSLQHIKCSITLGNVEKCKDLVEYYRNIAKNQEEIEKNQIKCEILATSIKEKLQDSIQLKEREMGFKIVTETLQNTNSISQAAIDRERISSDWDLSHMREVLRHLKIALVQAEVSRASFEFTQQDIEYELENRQNISKGLITKRDQSQQHLNQLFESLQQITKQIRENDTLTEEGPSKRELNFNELYNKWAATEDYYHKCFKESERRINNLKHEKELLQKQRDIENSKNQHTSVIATSMSENENHTAEILSQVENRLKSFGDKIEGSLLKSIELNIERSLTTLKGALNSQQSHYQQQQASPNIEKNNKENNNDSSNKYDLLLQQRLNSNPAVNNDDESDDTDELFVPSSPFSSPLKRKIKTRGNKTSSPTLDFAKISSTLQLLSETAQEQKPLSKHSPKPASPLLPLSSTSSPKQTIPALPAPLKFSPGPASPSLPLSSPEIVDNKYNNILENNVIVHSSLIDKLSIEDDNEFKKIISLDQRKLPPAELQNDDDEENFFIPSRPKPTNDFDEEKKKKKKENKGKQNLKVKHQKLAPSTSTSSSSQLPKPKDDEMDKEASGALKKKRKLRPNKAILDDLDMSPVLGGYADNFFNVT